jgi:hypothetical protein
VASVAHFKLPLAVGSDPNHHESSWEALTRQRARTQRPAAVRGTSCAPRQLEELPSDNSPVGPRHETSLHVSVFGPGLQKFSRRGRAFKFGCNLIDSLSNS